MAATHRYPALTVACVVIAEPTSRRWRISARVRLRTGSPSTSHVVHDCKQDVNMNDGLAAHSPVAAHMAQFSSESRHLLELSAGFLSARKSEPNCNVGCVKDATRVKRSERPRGVEDILFARCASEVCV